MSLYIYAETAFHHEGEKEYLLKLVEAAKSAGVSGVKFQVLIDLNEFMSSKHTAYEQAKDWILSFDDWKEVFQYTQELGLDIILMPLDTKAFEFSWLFNIKYIEIHSVSFKDEKLLEKLNEDSIPLILGIGGRTLDEVDEIVRKQQSRSVTLMVGFQSFPSELEDIKLGRISELTKMYPQCVIGYADHSSFDDEMAVKSNEYAYILGARVFEKHITINEGKDRIDFQSAIGVEKLSLIREGLNRLEGLFGVDEKSLFTMNEKEINYRNRQKVPVAKYKLETGHQLQSSDLELKMIDNEKSVPDLSSMIGKKLQADIQKDSAFTQGDLY